MATSIDDVAINPTGEADVPEATEAPATDAGQPQEGDAGEGAEQPSQQAAPAPQAPPATTGDPEWWKPDLFKLKYRGSEVSPKDHAHAVALMQKGWSYEQALQGIEQRKKELDGRSQKYDSYDKLDEAFKKNPAFAQRIQQMWLEAQQQQQQPGQPLPQQYHNQQLAPEILERLDKYDRYIAQSQNADADRTVRSEIESLRGAFPDENWDGVTETGFTFLRDVLKHAHDNQFPSIASAYRDYTYDRVANNAKMAGAEHGAKQRQSQARRGVVSTGAPQPAQSAPAKDYSQMSYDEITAEIKQEAGL